MAKEQDTVLQACGAGVPLAPCHAEDDGSRQGLSCQALGWGATMLVSGTLVTVSQSILFKTTAEGFLTCPDGHGGTTTMCAFNKPWYTTLVMKMAMSLCLLVHLATKPRSQSSDGTPVAEATWATIARIALPSFLDTANVVLSAIGLVWVSPSIYQMTRGSVVIFSAVLSIHLLRKRLLKYQYWAVALVTAAIVLVGAASLMTPKDKSKGTGESASLMEVIIGLLFILFSQGVLAYQIVVEERMMTSDNITPFQLAGYEGLWGLLYFAVLVPVLTFTPDGTSPLTPSYHEDFRDSFQKLFSSTSLLVWSAIFFVVIGVYNVSGQAVTKHLSAVLRSILEACRTLGVWVADLLIFYVLRMQEGEAWTPWSWLELVGFGFLVYGTMAYKGLAPVPCARVPRGAAETPAIPRQCSSTSGAGSWMA